MCGIVGYVGPKNALKVVLEGLEKLEYRGYDSAGVAYVTEDKKVSLSRAQGKLSALKDLLYKNEFNTHAILGIGHTRWATHGKPSEENAHPHVAGRVSLIHNGIIENYVELRAELLKKGAKFLSETDTEVAAHLLNDFLSQGLSPLDALKETCKKVRGSYAFVAIDSNSPDRMLVAKTATPIVIGVGEGEIIVASDIPAILPHTKQVKILEDGDIAEVTKDSISIFHEGRPVDRKTQVITWDPVTAQKGGFKHFMLKEIHDQITASSDALRGRIMGEGISIHEVDLDFSKFDRIVITACGTAWHAGLVAKFFFESLAKIPTEVDYASEFRYRTPVLDSRTLVIAISQSGETADTLGAIDIAKKSSKTLAVCNVVGSSLTRKTDATIYTQAGPEVSVASTKAFTTQLLTTLLLALKMAEVRKTISDVGPILKDMQHVPSAVRSAISNEGKIEELSRKIHTARDVIFLGRGICFPIALEGALKLKEVSYIHAEGYPSGEIKHGPLALIDENVPVVILLHKSDVLLEKSISNLREVEARGGRVIAVTDTKLPQEILNLCEGVIEVPFISELMTPVIMTIPLQLLAYHVAVLNGTDVDLPRNLAKSVTVE
jgi:glucosamine--fructose-6-phosphate aminotransferase (isomerizing)